MPPLAIWGHPGRAPHVPAESAPGVERLAGAGLRGGGRPPAWLAMVGRPCWPPAAATALSEGHKSGHGDRWRIGLCRDCAAGRDGGRGRLCRHPAAPAADRRLHRGGAARRPLRARPGLLRRADPAVVAARHRGAAVPGRDQAGHQAHPLAGRRRPDDRPGPGRLHLCLRLPDRPRPGAGSDHQPLCRRGADLLQHDHHREAAVRQTGRSIPCTARSRSAS